MVQAPTGPVIPKPAIFTSRAINSMAIREFCWVWATWSFTRRDLSLVMTAVKPAPMTKTEMTVAAITSTSVNPRSPWSEGLLSQPPV